MAHKLEDRYNARHEISLHLDLINPRPVFPLPENSSTSSFRFCFFLRVFAVKARCLRQGFLFIAKRKGFSAKLYAVQIKVVTMAKEFLGTLVNEKI